MDRGYRSTATHDRRRGGGGANVTGVFAELDLQVGLADRGAYPCRDCREVAGV